MKRVKRNTRYYFIIIANGKSLIVDDIDRYRIVDKERFDSGNYFIDKNIAIETGNKIEQIFINNKNNN